MRRKKLYPHKLPPLKNYRWEGGYYLSFLFVVESMSFRQPFQHNKYAFNKRDVICQGFDTSFETLEHRTSLFNFEVVNSLKYNWVDITRMLLPLIAT